ncbi:MAG: penicillin-binding protein 2, partial [Candidatus Kerfeldbacteria bacterium]|nr:penicillin-binding protein 2 [Candidatus Kerfeldbacteria bacterium]
TMTLAAAIDQGLITPETTFDDSGSVQIGKYTIRNADEKKYGVQTMNQVLEQSINTGAIFTVQKLGTDRFRDYLERFGFGTKTGIPLQGENDGDISTLSKSGEIYAATASFGQGMAVTPLQLLMAYAALVNDGKLMKPRLVEAIIKPNGFRESIDPETVREVVSPDTARLMKAMMVNVVRNGHGQRAGVPGYYVGGKTGTAQIPYGDRPGYKPDEHIGTFVGFAPLTDPAFVMLTKIDVPRDVRFAESSVAPLFGDLAAFLLNYYRVPPDDARPDS